MAHLAMYVQGLPRLRVSGLTRDNAVAVCEVVSGMESTFFGDTQTNVPEILGTLHAPELHGARGTAGIWDGDQLVATLLAYDEVRFEGSVFLDLFLAEHPRRGEIARRLVCAAEDYAVAIGGTGAWLKVETFDGDAELVEILREDGFTQHRVYLRMRIDANPAPRMPDVPPGFQVTGMTQDRWPQVHEVVMAAFQDHYDHHPIPLAEFERHFDRESTDLSRWRLVHDGDRLVGVGISSNRYAPHHLGYVDTLAVLREYRGRGIATYLLRAAFADDHTAGHTGTALHCDATNTTGAARLYTGLGMRIDQHYDAWRRRVG